MALPSPQSLQKLVAELNDVAKVYSTSPDLNGYMSRVHIIEKAKEITQSLISPDQMPNYHGRNVRVPTTRDASPIYLTGHFPIDGRSDRYPNIHEAQGLREDTC
jgi:hypothetical protein